MAKVRVTVSIIMEFEPNPAYYPEGSTPLQMAQIDAEQFQSPDILTEYMQTTNDEFTITSTAEVIEGEAEPNGTAVREGS
jgi:hypothetical protein